MLALTHMLAHVQAHKAAHLPPASVHSRISAQALTLPEAGVSQVTACRDPPQASIHSHLPTHPKGQGEQKEVEEKVLPMRSRRFTRLSTSATDVALN